MSKVHDDHSDDDEVEVAKSNTQKRKTKRPDQMRMFAIVLPADSCLLVEPAMYTAMHTHIMAVCDEEFDVTKSYQEQTSQAKSNYLKSVQSQ